MPKQLHIFDLDETLIDGNISLSFGRYLYKRKIFSLYQVIQALLSYCLFLFHFISLEKMHQRIFNELFKHRKASEITHHAHLFLSELLDSSFANPIALGMLTKAQGEGSLVALFSSSPDFLVEPIAHFFRFDEWLASKYSIDKEGSFCDISLVIDGYAKAAQHAVLCKKYALTSKETYVYTDSANDLPLMLSAGYCIVFRPPKKLLIKCLANDWLALFP